jgi:hypothetical protein
VASVDSLPPPSDPKERPLTFVSAAVWSLLAYVLMSLFLQFAKGGREGVYLDMVTLTACEVLAYSVVLFALLRVHEPETSIRRVLAIRQPPVLAMILAVAIGAALALPSEWLNQALESKLKDPVSPDDDLLEHLFSVATTGKRIALVVTFVVIQPIANELFFRGALFTPLRRTRKAEEVVLATAAFETLRSGSPRMMIILLFASLVFSWLRATTGSIFPSIFARIAYFGVAAIPIVLGRELPKPTKLWLGGAVAVTVLGLFGIAALGRRDARILEARSLD